MQSDFEHVGRGNDLHPPCGLRTPSGAERLVSLYEASLLFVTRSGGYIDAHPDGHPIPPNAAYQQWLQAHWQLLRRVWPRFPVGASLIEGEKKDYWEGITCCRTNICVVPLSCNHFDVKSNL